MDINCIECFLTVARTLNFSEAARRSYISQSMVSRYIGKLENELNTKLFVRTNKEVALTAEGKALLPYAIEITDNLKKARFAIEQLKSGYEGRVKILCDGASANFVSLCIKEFSQKYPGIAVDISEIHGEGESLNEGGYDCIFGLRDMLPDNENIEYAITHTDTLSLAVTKYRERERFSFSTLNNEKFVLLSETENPILYMEIMDIFRASHILPTVVSRPESVKSVLIGVSAGLGISVLPSGLMEDFSERNIARVELSDIDTSLVYAAAWNKNTTNSSASLFWEIVKKHSRQEEYEY